MLHCGHLTSVGAELFSGRSDETLSGRHIGVNAGLSSKLCTVAHVDVACESGLSAHHAAFTHLG